MRRRARHRIGRGDRARPARSTARGGSIAPPRAVERRRSGRFSRCGRPWI